MGAVIRNCTICRRHEGGPYKMPVMAPLPKSCVTSAVPFSRTGLDYLGPMYSKTSDGQRKVWVCLFTCMVTRAIHLELMQDMSAEEFLLGFRRFISTRGSPNEITSDNAKQFKTASDGQRKVWVCLFTCMVTRAIHLELMQDMSAEEFLLGFRRFISTRGSPNEITRDNAKQFKTASKALDLLWKGVIKCDEVQNYASNKGVK